MRELTWENAAALSSRNGRVPAGQKIRVRELSGGVSNVVLRVDTGRSPPVRDQAVPRAVAGGHGLAGPARPDLGRARLRSTCWEILLPRGTVPEVLFEDRPNYLFAMTCAPDDSETWKTLLMNGIGRPEYRRLAWAASWQSFTPKAPEHPQLRGTLADTSLFDELRIDPYYRTVARAHPDLAARIEDAHRRDGCAGPASARWCWATSVPRTSWWPSEA